MPDSDSVLVEPLLKELAPLYTRCSGESHGIGALVCLCLVITCGLIKPLSPELYAHDRGRMDLAQAPDTLLLNAEYMRPPRARQSAPNDLRSLPSKSWRQLQQVFAEPRRVKEPVADYQPKVSTWGVFPRPLDISKTYGGGKVIPQGGYVTTAEEKAASDAKFAEMMRKYRLERGLIEIEITPEVQAEYDALWSEARRLTRGCDWDKAADKFAEAAKVMPANSEQFGLAGLERAMCLDRAQRYDEAESAYRKLSMHNKDSIRKKAKGLAYGFEAEEFLKVDQMDWLIPDPNRLDPHFKKCTNLNTVWAMKYKEKTPEEEEELRRAYLSDLLVSLGVMGFPFVFVIVLRVQQGMVIWPY